MCFGSGNGRIPSADDAEGQEMFYLEIFEEGGYPSGLRMVRASGFDNLPPGMYYHEPIKRSELGMVFHWYARGVLNSTHGPTGFRWEADRQMAVDENMVILEKATD